MKNDFIDQHMLWSACHIHDRFGDIFGFQPIAFFRGALDGIVKD
jgi:hypothetical protein